MTASAKSSPAVTSLHRSASRSTSADTGTEHRLTLFALLTIALVVVHWIKRRIPYVEVQRGLPAIGLATRDGCGYAVAQ
jgi:hypothetical protein